MKINTDKKIKGLSGHTSIDDARQWILDNTDIDWFEMLIRHQYYLLHGTEDGYEGGRYVSMNGDNEIPDFIDLTPRYKEVGQSQKLLLDTYLMGNVLTASRPKFQYDDVDDMTQAMRDAVIESRWQGVASVAGGYEEHMIRRAMDSYALGVGYIRWGFMETNHRGYPTQYTVAQHYSPTQVIVDRFANPYYNGVAVAFVSYLSREQSIAMFGRDATDENIRTSQGVFDGNAARSYKYVKVIEYYDRGIDGKKPTHIIWLNGVSGDPVYMGPNVYGTLPLSSMEAPRPPGCPRPMGAVHMGVGNQALRQAMEQKILRYAEDGEGFTVFDPAAINMEEFEERRKSGALHMALNDDYTFDSGKPPFFNVPPAQLNPVDLQVLQYFMNEGQQEGASSALDMNTPIPDSKSATETALIAEGSDRRKSGYQRSLTQAYVRDGQLFSIIARHDDTDPLKCNVQYEGETFVVPLNNPDEPGSSLEYVFQEESRVTIDAQAMNVADQQRKKAAALAELVQLISTGLVGPNPGMIAPNKVAERYLRTIGVNDIEEWLNSQSEIDPAMMQEMMSQGGQMPPEMMQ